MPSSLKEDHRVLRAHLSRFAGRAARAGARGPLPPSEDSVIFKQFLIGAALMALAVIGRVGLRVAHILRAAPPAIPKSQDDVC